MESEMTPAISQSENLYTVGNHVTHLGSRRLVNRETHELILVPTPSDDPNDPLNWSSAMRLYAVGLAAFANFMTTFVTAGPAIAIVETAVDFFGPPGPGFEHNIARVAYFLTTTPMLQGVSQLVWIPIAIKYGRRPIYVATFFFFTITSIWAGFAQTYSSELASRILMGVFSGAPECLPALVVTDVSFLHQRGTLMSLNSAAVSMGPAMGILLSGFIVKDYSWRYIFHICTAVLGALTLLLFFTLPETFFVRPVALAQARPFSVSTTDPKMGVGQEEVHLEQHESSGQDRPRRMTYYERITLKPRTYTKESLLRMACRSIGVLVLPPVLWESLVEAVMIGFYIAISSNVAVAFGSTYHFETWQIGLCYMAPFVGALLSVSVSGPFLDWTANFFTRRNNGIREPEMRLPALIVGGTLAPAGIIIYGAGIHNKWHWVVPTIGVGFLNFGLVQAVNGCIVYSIDAYRSIGGEVLVAQFAFKSCLGFLLSFYTNPWIVNQGYLYAFGEMAGITAAVALTTVPLYFYGKRIRRASLKWKAVRFIHWKEDREVGE